MELLLRNLCNWGFSSCRCREKKEVFDAVIGVVGVLEIILVGGGLVFLSDEAWVCS